MGITIHYNGRFNPDASLKNMIEEVKDIAETFEWKYFIFDEYFPEKAENDTVDKEGIYGITISIPDCESLDLCFLSNKRMSSAALLQFYGESSNPKYKEYLYCPQ